MINAYKVTGESTNTFNEVYSNLVKNKEMLEAEYEKFKNVADMGYMPDISMLKVLRELATQADQVLIDFVKNNPF